MKQETYTAIEDKTDTSVWERNVAMLCKVMQSAAYVGETVPRLAI